MSPKLIFLAVTFLSIVLCLRLINHFTNIKAYPSGELITFEARVPTQPKISSRAQQFSLNLPNSQKVILRTSLNPSISYGDKVKIEGEIEYFQAQNGDLVAIINYPKFELIKKGTEDNLILKARERIIKFFRSNLNPIYSGLILGIVFGIKEEMPQVFYENLQKSGLMHVIAASGMNITMVGGFLLSLFGYFLARKIALVATIFGIIFYAVMAGLEASIVRASVMGILVFLAQLLGRQSSSILGLFAAGFIMLFISPSLLFDIGFQLSFMATFGLIFFSPLFFIRQKMKLIIQKSLIGSDVVTTITAQIFTLPILLLNFGSYSASSILANATLLWTVPIIMVIGGASAITSFISEPLARLISYLSLPILLYFEAVVNFFSAIGPQISLGDLPISLILGYYLILFALALFARKRI